MSTVNTLFVTLPVVETIYAAKGAFIVALGCIPFNVILFTYGIARLRGGSAGGFRMKDILSTPLIATLFAIGLFALRVPVPTPVRSILSSVASATVPMSMLLVGSSLGNVELKGALRDKSMLLLLAERFVLAPLVMFFVMKLICPDDGAFIIDETEYESNYADYQGSDPSFTETENGFTAEEGMRCLYHVDGDVYYLIQVDSYDYPDVNPEEIFSRFTVSVAE